MEQRSISEAGFSPMHARRWRWVQKWCSHRERWHTGWDKGIQQFCQKHDELQWSMERGEKVPTLQTKQKSSCRQASEEHSGPSGITLTFIANHLLSVYPFFHHPPCRLQQCTWRICHVKPILYCLHHPRNASLHRPGCASPHSCLIHTTWIDGGCKRKNRWFHRIKNLYQDILWRPSLGF